MGVPELVVGGQWTVKEVEELILSDLVGRQLVRKKMI